MNLKMLLTLAVLLLSCAGRSEVKRLDYAAARSGGAVRAAVVADPADAANGVLRRFSLGADAAPPVGDLAVGDELEVVLFADVALNVRLVERTPSRGGRQTFLATVDGYGETRNAVVVASAAGVQIDVQDYRRGRVYTVASGCGGVTVSEQDPRGGRRTCACATGPSAATAGAPALAQSVQSSDNPYVDVMIAYDTMAAAYAESTLGGITNFAETCVQKMNTALANTGLDARFRFRLVGVYAAPGNAGGSISYVLNSIVSAGVTLNGYNWSELEDARSACGADVVSVLVDNYSAYGTTGSGYSYSPGNAADFADSAYNACLIRAVAQGHTMTHEVGHNMGAGHATEVDPSQITPGPQYYGYSAGHYFTANGRSYCTIMAYNFDGFGNSYDEVPYFSSPDHTYCGVPVGDAFHDNSRTLANTFRAVSEFRRGDFVADELGEALELPEYEWRTSGAFPWSLARDHGVVRSCEMAGRTTSVLYTTLRGPATVRFGAYVRTYGGTFAVGYDDYKAYLDQGALHDGTPISGSVQVPAGVHTLKISYTHPAQGFTVGPGNGVWLTSLSIVGGEPYKPHYTVRFHRNDGSEKTFEQEIAPDETARLSSLTALGWARKGFVFRGWSTSPSSQAVRYANWASVCNAAAEGARLDLYAVWQLAAGYYEIRFNKYDGSGAWRSVAFAHGTKTRIPSLANGLGWAKRGFDFQGWSTGAGGAVWKADWAYVSEPVKPGQTLNVWASWTPKEGYYILRFIRNDGTAAWRAVGFPYGVKTRMPSLANGLGWRREDRDFIGWSLNSKGAVWKEDWAYLAAPFPAGTVRNVYAIWE